MKLLLRRRYRPKRTIGNLSCTGKVICKTIEAPNSIFNPPEECLPEGKYPLQLIHSEIFGWMIGVGQNEEGRIRSLNDDSVLQKGCIYPITCWRADGTPMFFKLAHLRLMDKMAQAWENGEEIELEIVCEPVPYRLERCSALVSC